MKIYALVGFTFEIHDKAKDKEVTKFIEDNILSQLSKFKPELDDWYELEEE